MSYGTLDTRDLLSSVNETVKDFGEERLAKAILGVLKAHNDNANEMYEDLMDRTTRREQVYGTAEIGVMRRTDQYGQPLVQKVSYGQTVGFPLESHQGAWQGTLKYFKSATVSELMAQVDAMRAADLDCVKREVQRALFVPTNYSFTDYLVNRLDQIPIQVKALINADNSKIPPGPSGQTFDGATHSHYLGTASPAASDYTALLETVLEHYNQGEARLYINRAQEQTIKTYTSNFTPYLVTNVVGSNQVNQIQSKSTSGIPLYNRAIGMFNNAEVWIKPWIPAGYVFAFMKGPRKPLALRTRVNGGDGLVLAATSESYPLRAETYEHEFGIGVQERTNGAVLYLGGASYTAPTIAM